MIIHNKELTNFYSSPDIARMFYLRSIALMGLVARMGVLKNTNFVVGMLEGKRPLGKSRCRCENNTKMNLKGYRMWNGLIMLRTLPMLGIVKTVIRNP
jgi:hypothetical protein